ncbi:hypothetical protein DFJ69_6025 [Thermomonospora umbrina]|uniref:MobA/VirD2-like nuclease domain-containing protein n=2 Tax=Thermomonospora umbrina TaxID=111806 RepID=A0A3D9SWZ7_9ACTN|nr:hypothetical protein DFJ69_6025 [Thermomonospora umbrina]
MIIRELERGSDIAGLLYYLYGPGRANEHTDPHLIAGFRHPTDLEPPLTAEGDRNFRYLIGLLAQPADALGAGTNPQPVFHVVIRLAPDDPSLTDDQWADIAHRIMDSTGLAPYGQEEEAVRWIAVRHADDHIHLMATLARQDGRGLDVNNLRYRMQAVRRDLELRHRLHPGAPGDRSAARSPTRAEVEKAARMGWEETARQTLARRVAVAAAAAGTLEAFFARLRGAGTLVRTRNDDSGQPIGYAVALPENTDRTGDPVWYGGRCFAAGTTLPKLRRRWNAIDDPQRIVGPPLPEPRRSVVTAVLRAQVRAAARLSSDESDFTERMREAGLVIRTWTRLGTTDGTSGYVVGLPGHLELQGRQVLIAGTQLAEDLSLPRLRAFWADKPTTQAPPPATPASDQAAWTAVLTTASDAVALLTEHTGDDHWIADAVHAAADLLRTLAEVCHEPALHEAADDFERAATEPYGRVPPPTRVGSGLRAAARMLAWAGPAISAPEQLWLLADELASLSRTIAELRTRQRRPAQASAAQQTSSRLRELVASASGATYRNASAKPATSVGADDFPTLSPSHVSRPAGRRRAAGDTGHNAHEPHRTRPPHNRQPRPPGR